MLQIRHQDEADNDHQKPGCYFAGGHHVPHMDLVGILPGAEVGGDILGYPDEKSDEEEADIHVHPAHFCGDGEIHTRLPEKSEHHGDQKVAEIVDVVIGEKVEIDEEAKHGARSIVLVVGQVQFHNLPRLADVAAHCRIHEAAVEWHSRDLEECRLGIAPGADPRTSFVQLENEADDVKEEDNLHLVLGLEFGEIEDGLDQHRSNKEKIVSRNAEKRNVVGQKKQQKERTRKDAGAGLFEAEEEEFVHMPSFYKNLFK